jgi:vancomycin resistance protein YoaR
MSAASAARNGKGRRRGRGRGRRWLRYGSAAVAVVAVLLLAYLIDSAVYYGKVHAGVKVAGISLGGLTRDEAASALARLAEDAQDNPITLVSGDRQWKVMPSALNTRINVEEGVSDAMEVSRKSNLFADLFRRVGLYFRDIDLPLEGTVDSAAMDALLAEIAGELDLPPINAGLVIDGKNVKAMKGQKGLVVDQAALREQLKALLFSLHATELEIPMMVEEPAVMADDFDQALAQAKIMVSKPVALRESGKLWNLTTEQIAAYMDFTVEDRAGVASLVPFLSAAKMGPFLDEVAAEVYLAPKDATFKGDGKKAWVVEAVSGKKLDPEETAKALTAAALKTSDRTARAAVVSIEPDLTTEEAQAMGITDVLGSFTTRWEGTPQRQTNVRLATKYVNNVLLAPGEIFDFDKQVGPRTEKRGYQMAPGIVAPGRLEDVFGGGICQVSTTLFNAAFFAGLEIIERVNHSIFIEHYPLGRDATVSAGGPNLRFRNDTQHYILVRGASDGITTKFVIYGTDEGRQVEFTTSEPYDVVERTDETTKNTLLGTGTSVVVSPGQQGMVVKVVRIVTGPDGKVIHKDTFISEWEMIPRKIDVGTVPTTTTTTKPPTTTTTKPPTTTTESSTPPVPS